jgi:ubiquinone/menaquinone biosynthesis C-methylase UbiE
MNRMGPSSWGQFGGLAFCHSFAPADRPRYEAEAWRVLRPGGRFLLRACLTSAGKRNEVPLDLADRYFGRWQIVAAGERALEADRRTMRAVVARLAKPAPGAQKG